MPRRRKQIQETFPYEATAIITQDDIYMIINYVQLARKSCSFVADKSDSVVIEHLLRDCKIEFDSKTLNKGVRYSLKPPPVNIISEEVFAFEEDYADEIIEDGQCF